MSTRPLRASAALNTAEYVLRYMRIEDIPAVATIDGLSFPTPWPPRSYAFEINNSETSHMIVLESRQVLRGWRKIWSRLMGRVEMLTIVGYAGLWCIGGEAHVSTIAVHPEWRGKGLGEVLLNGLLNRALSLAAEYSVLEVRVGNTSAQALYVKYGYEIIGRRKNYYRDNNEDAFLMNLTPFDSAFTARLRNLSDQLHCRVIFTDRLAETGSQTIKVQSRPGLASN